MKKDKIHTINLTSRQLKELFIRIAVCELMKRLVSEERDGKTPQPSKIYQRFQPFFSKKELETLVADAKVLIDEYLQWSEMDELNWFLDKEKDVLQDVLRETEKIGAGFKAEDLVERINRKFLDEGIVNASFRVKKRDD